MKHAINRGERIAYEVLGPSPAAGRPAVVLQHGLAGRRQVWREFGYVDVLTPDFTVIALDSLGHGDSDKPAEAAFYARAARVDDIAAVLDAERIDRAHYVGYSMGAWLGVGILAYRPDRLRSLTIGNFDPVPSASPRPSPSIERFLELARAAVPGAVDWVTAEVVPALARCLEAVMVQEIPIETLTGSTIPVNFWTGSEDASCASLRRLHEAMPNSTLSVVPGDHIGTMRGSSRESAAAIRAFLTRLPA